MRKNKPRDKHQYYCNKYIWYRDYYRTTDDEVMNWKHFFRDYLFQHRLRYMVYLRKSQISKCRLFKMFYEYKLFKLGRKYGIEVNSSTKIGAGFVMTHPYNITINSKAVIGKNVNIMKGATIGSSGGKKAGTPIIGDCVYIGLNSTIIGGVSIGNDVMIAPNTFVNCDVPDHSVVVGNPCVIKHKENATSEYIYYRVE